MCAQLILHGGSQSKSDKLLKMNRITASRAASIAPLCPVLWDMGQNVPIRFGLPRLQDDVRSRRAWQLTLSKARFHERGGRSRPPYIRAIL